MRSAIGSLLGTLGLVLAAGAAHAESVRPRTLETRVTSIALFKNGLAFVSREAALPREDARLRLEGLPVPVHGTFWAWSPGRPEGVRRLTASLEPRKSMAPVQSLADLLMANAGRDAEVVFADGKLVKGRVVAPPDRPSNESFDTERLPPAPRPLLLTTSEGTIAFDPGSVQRVQVLGAPPATTLDRRVPQATLDLDAAGGADAKLELVYLSHGATWAPSYSVELLGKDRARVTAKAEVINELEDIESADVRLVTGYPNIAWSAVDDPIAMRGDLAAFLAAMGSLRQNIAYDRMEASAPVYSPSPPAGERADELFLYPLPKFSLPRGQRAYVPLFSVDCAAEHLYELDLDDRVRDDRIDSNRGGSQPPLEIWHRVRLTNAGTVPWTTAPAMATRGGAIVAQDELAYAAPGATSTLRITRVSDLRADADEFEVERKPRALEVHGRAYDEITLRGVAEITSFRDDDVTVTVTKSLTGTVTLTTPDGKVEKLGQRLNAVNPSSTIRWAIPLKARSKASVGYRYTVYVQI